MTKKIAIKIFTDFVMGKLSAYDFWKMYKNDAELRDILVKDRKRKKGVIKTKTDDGVPVVLRFNDKNFPINPDNLLQVIDINRLEHRFELLIIINRFLLMRGIIIPERNFNQDYKEYQFMQSMLPSYVECEFMFLQKLYSEAPAEYSKSKKLSWCKSKIKEMFTYDNKAPNWHQAPQWPWANGTPMVFSHQETSAEGIEKYYFYDKITKEQAIIKQIE